MRYYAFFPVLLCFFTFSRAIAQPGFCGSGSSTFYSANIIFNNNLHPTLNGQILPFGSHIIAVFQQDSNWQCAGFIQWNGNSVSMIVNGDDGNLPGYKTNEPYKFIVQLPSGCLIDSILVTYDTSGIYTNAGNFQDGGLSRIASFQSFSREWVSLDPNNGLCADNTAVIETNVTSINMPASFVWSNGDSTSTISDLAAGNYTVTVTNPFGCTATAQASVSSIPAMSIQLTTEYQPSVIACQSVANVTGGTSPFTFAWSNGQTDSVAINLHDGEFTVTITDTNGCTGVQTDHCTVSAVSAPPGPAYISVTPNPSDGKIKMEAAFIENADIHISIYNPWGKRIFFHEIKSAEVQLNADLSTAAPGIYFLVLQADGYNRVQKLIIF